MPISHQRYRVLAAGIFSLLLCMGIARFAYTPLLPLMQQQAGLGFAEGGWLAAVNYLGYLCGALIAATVGDLVLKDRLYRLAIGLAIVTTVMMGLSDHWLVWLVSRFFAGLSTAGAMLLGTGLILNWLMRHGQRPELGIHFSGIGLGIAGCAAAVGLASQWLDWREQWLALSAIACLLAWPALAWLPRPDGQGSASPAQLADAPPSRRFFVLLLIAYFCCGVGYVVTATFIVAIVDALPAMQGQGSLVFLVLGLAAAPACIAWDFIARRLGEINALLLAAVLQIAGILLPLAPGGLPVAMAGACLFGFTFIGLVSLVLTLAGKFYPTRPAKMMGKMTLSYGVAQMTAPAIIGIWAGGRGAYDQGLLLAAGAMVLACLLLLVLRLTAVESKPRLAARTA